MQHTTRTLRLARSALGLAAGAGLGCSKEYALGDVTPRDLAVESAPPDTEQTAAAMATPDVDFTLAPFLPPPDVTLGSEIDGGFFTQFNRLISGVGDLDADGFEDFASQGFDPATSREFVHVRYGGLRPKDAEEAFALQESGVRLMLPEFFTRGMVETILPAGDVDGDGYADLLVGTGRCLPGLQGEGAYLLYGGPERLSGVHRFDEVSVYLPRPQATAPAEPSGSCARDLWDHIAALGDFDGDGFDDFVLGDPPELEYSLDEQGGSVPSSAPDGALYLFYGGPQRLVSGSPWSSAGARFVAPRALVPNAIGDVNADGRTDLILHAIDLSQVAPDTFFWIPGDDERLASDFDVLGKGTELADLSLTWTSSPITLGPNDVDGDGTTDLVALGGENLVLFFGRPGLFDGGVDLSQDGVVLTDDLSGPPLVEFAGDRDGDGDADLFSHVDYSVVDETALYFKRDVAFVGGSKQRFNGSVSFPAQSVLQQNPTGTLSEADRFMTRASFAGDLDGDGASDLLTTSFLYSPDESASVLSSSEPRLHIHYGVRGSGTPPLR
jgi:hypothetical protein